MYIYSPKLSSIPSTVKEVKLDQQEDLQIKNWFKI